MLNNVSVTEEENCTAQSRCSASHTHNVLQLKLTCAWTSHAHQRLTGANVGAMLELGGVGTSFLLTRSCRVWLLVICTCEKHLRCKWFESENNINTVFTASEILKARMNTELQMIVYHKDEKSVRIVLVTILRGEHMCKHSRISVVFSSCFLLLQ